MSPEEQQQSQQQSHLSEAPIASTEPQQAKSVEQLAEEKEQAREPQDVHQQVQDIAIQIGEDPAHLSKRQDVTQVLERMKEGIVVTVHISRPRFVRKLTLDDLGLTAGETLATSEAANKVLNEYFELGRRSLLPKTYQDRLNVVETSARQCVARSSFKSHWGAFVPLTMYPQWKEENARLEAEFWSVKEEIVSNYEAITEQVIEDARPLAEDAWRRVMLGAVLTTQEDALTGKVLTKIVQRLRAGEGKEKFVENYLHLLRAAIPHKWEIADGFAYEVERSVIPLPSLLAADMEQADRIYRDRALKDARTRAELQAIEAQRRAELEQLSLQQRMEHERHYQQLRVERERQQRQLEMEQDVLNDARRQKDRLVQQFYTGVVQQINTQVFSVTQNVLDSLEDNGGIIRGRVSLQLSNLVKQLEQLNFVENEQIESQLERLRAVLPTEEEKEQAGKGLARINTTRISKVVRAINKEAEDILVDLGAQPQARKSRNRPSTDLTPELMGTRRTARPSTVSTSSETRENEVTRSDGLGLSPRRREQSP